MNELPVLTQFELYVEAHGPGRCDADNLIGSLLDAGLPDKRSQFEGCWKDDRVTVVPYISFRWVRTSSSSGTSASCTTPGRLKHRITVGSAKAGQA